SKIVVDLFKTLGASPVSLAAAEIYTALKNNLVDGTATGLAAIEAFKLYEVQKFVSLTNHAWSGLRVAASSDSWKKLPADLQAIVERNNTAFAAANRRDLGAADAATRTRLTQQGISI